LLIEVARSSPRDTPPVSDATIRFHKIKKMAPVLCRKEALSGKEINLISYLVGCLEFIVYVDKRHIVIEKYFLKLGYLI
jgi:hypothetical protein